MRIKNYIYLSLREFIKNKKNIMNILIIAVISAFVLFGFSFSKSADEYWDTSVKELVDYRTFLTYYDTEKYTEKEAIEKLSQYKHILSVSKYSSYLINMNILGYTKDKNDTSILLIGVPSSSVEVMVGKNLADYNNNEKVIICPDRFYPYIEKNNNNKKTRSAINLVDKLDSDLNLTFVTSNEKEKFKLVGVYNSKLNPTESNVCYTSIAIVDKLNYYYQPDAYLEKKGVTYPLVMVVDKTKNNDSVINEISKDNFIINDGSSVLKMDTENGNKIMFYIRVILITLTFIFIIFAFLLSLKIQKENEKKYAVLKTLGYNNKNIVFLKYLDALFTFACAGFSSIFIGSGFVFLFQKVLESKTAAFEGLNIEIGCISILLSQSTSFLIPFLFTVIINRKSHSQKVIDILKE